MYLNKCTKCGTEFETKNPKRVICPDCLYPDRNTVQLKSYSQLISPEPNQENPGSPQPQENENFPPKSNFRPNEYAPQNDRYKNTGGGFREPQQGGGFRGPQQGGGFRGPQQDGGFRGPQQGGGFRGPQQGGGFRGPQQGGGFRGPQQGGGFRGPQQGGGFRRPPQGGGFGRPQQGGGFRRPPQGGGFRRPGAPFVKKSLLISREQVGEIEKLYKSNASFA